MMQSSQKYIKNKMNIKLNIIIEFIYIQLEVQINRWSFKVNHRDLIGPILGHGDLFRPSHHHQTL